jgi:hypothetical protein
MEIRIVDENKLAVHATLGEVAEALAQRLEKKKEQPVTTPQIMAYFNLSRTTITNYADLGMPKRGYNRWMISECEEWINTVLPKILSKPGRKTKPKK